MGLELEGTNGTILIHKVHADSQAARYAWMRAGLRVAQVRGRALKVRTPVNNFE